MRRLISLFSALLIFASVFNSCKPDSIEELGSIYGIVTDKATGEPVKNANVQLRPSGETTLTGTDGRYEFVDLKNGEYSITVSKTEYTDLVDDYVIKVEGAKAMRRDVQIEKIPALLKILDSNGNEIDVLDFGSMQDDNTRMFSIFNNSTSALDYEIFKTAAWVASLSSQEGSLQPGATKSIIVVIDRDMLVVGKNVTTLSILTNNGGKQLTLKANKSDGNGEDPEEPENPDEPDDPNDPEEPDDPDEPYIPGAINISVGGVSFKMIEVEGGTYMMGNDGEIGGNIDETPKHSVTLDAFYIGETEVTQELWNAVMGSNPSVYVGNKKPVNAVNWNQCNEFIDKLNYMTGKTFRMPTEAEWEYAAKGGRQSKGYEYSGSNNVGSVAWYVNNSNYEPQDVKGKIPNELGIYDMSGNVFEWCSDWYGGYNSSAQTNPTGPNSGNNKVVRGGAFSYNDTYCRVARRFSCSPNWCDSYHGLRLVME
ncbi:MAG: SUMF1/EgtB/PvdO family nonheme iron enzyme [Bacteroidales bacterium]|nr:SUMF1/EgtB/PvdO family nonheme iron enzyme [Bacteroidales bacterium]